VGAASRAAAAPLPPPPDPGHRDHGHRPGRRGDRRAVGGEEPLKPPGDDTEDGPPGLAEERTELAWTRTAIGFAAVGAAVLKHSPLIGLPVLVVSAVIWRLGRLPGSTVTERGHDRRFLLITVTIVGISLVAVALSFAGPGVALFP
jgi:uncharacterized membrane protein YidH (DUF202 family)